MEEFNTIKKFRGFKKVYMVEVLEGDGVDEAYREVKYIFENENLCIGKIDPLKEHLSTK